MPYDTQPTASHFIDGQYVEDTAGELIEVIYPATGKVIARVHAATPEIVERAIASAKRAQAEWAAMTGTERGRILRRAADIMRDRNYDLSVLETYDTGKPLSETTIADATSGADALEYFGGLAGSLTGEHIPLGGGDFVYTRREALGVCVGIGAWNYPTQIACWKGAPALACGNTMVFKPSETTPLCALKVAEILHEAGAPAGVYNVIQGLGAVGAQLVTDPRVAKVSLTGSVPTGQTGQVCSNGTRVFVQKGIKEAFLKRLAERMDDAVIGDPLQIETTIGPMSNERQLGIVESYIQKGIEEGARLVKGGKRIGNEGFYIEPALFADVTDDMTIAREEIFGPVLSVLDFETEEDVMARANDTEFGLAAGVFTSDLTRAHRVVAGFEAGTCYINTYNLAPVEAPFGGSKLSGVGRENSKVAINHYSEVKTVYVSMNKCEAPF
ncbi:MAG: betaine aldehyde dehydrogenase [Marivivens sp.]|nr:betaine aldehyde dehydrogenase [Marivivens sp.]